MINSADFVPVKTTELAKKYARLYILKLVRLHGVSVSIIYDKVAQLEKPFHQGLG